MQSLGQMDISFLVAEVAYTFYAILAFIISHRRKNFMSKQSFIKD